MIRLVLPATFIFLLAGCYQSRNVEPDLSTEPDTGQDQVEDFQGDPLDVPEEDLALPDTWLRILEGESFGFGQGAVQTQDGGFLIAGTKSAESLGFENQPMGLDLWLMRLDRAGRPLWQKATTTFEDEWFSNVTPSTDEHIYIVFYRGFGDSSDVLVMKIDPEARIAWARIIDDSLLDSALSSCPSADGGLYFIMIRDIYNSSSWPGSLVAKTDSEGSAMWAKVISPENLSYEDNVYLYQLAKAHDGGILAAGNLDFQGSDFKGVFVMKLDANGDVIWQKLARGNTQTRPHSILETSDHGVLAGIRVSHTIHSPAPGYDELELRLLKFDDEGNILWQSSLEGPFISGMILGETADGGLLLSGSTNYEYQNSGACALIKTDGQGRPLWQKVFTLQEGCFWDTFIETAQGDIFILGWSDLDPTSGLVYLKGPKITMARLDRAGALEGPCPAMGEGTFVRSESDLFVEDSFLVLEDTDMNVQSVDITLEDTTAQFGYVCPER